MKKRGLLLILLVTLFLLSACTDSDQPLVNPNPSMMVTLYSLDELADFVSARGGDQLAEQLDATFIPSLEVMDSVFQAELARIFINRGNYIAFIFEVQDVNWEWYRQRAQAFNLINEGNDERVFIDEDLLRACAGEITITRSIPNSSYLGERIDDTGARDHFGIPTWMRVTTAPAMFMEEPISFMITWEHGESNVPASLLETFVQMRGSIFAEAETLAEFRAN